MPRGGGIFNPLISKDLFRSEIFEKLKKVTFFVYLPVAPWLIVNKYIFYPISSFERTTGDKELKIA